MLVFKFLLFTYKQIQLQNSVEHQSTLLFLCANFTSNFSESMWGDTVLILANVFNYLRYFFKKSKFFEKSVNNRVFSRDVIGVPKQRNSGHIGVPQQSRGNWTPFLCKNRLCFRKLIWLLVMWVEIINSVNNSNNNLNFEKIDRENLRLLELKEMSLKAKKTCSGKVENKPQTGIADKVWHHCDIQLFRWQ